MNKITIAIALVLLMVPFSVLKAQFDVDVGGDIQLRGIYRNDFGLTQVTAGSDDWFDTYLWAYLKANPSPAADVYVRMIAERDWGAEGVTTITPLTGQTETESTTGVDLDLAYFSLHEAWGSRATLTLGRQELLYGEGFLVGRNNTYRSGTYERSPRKAFDAAKVSYALMPFRLDFFTSVIEENYSQTDTYLHGANLTYDYLGTATLDFGLFYKSDGDTDARTIALSARGEAEIISIPGLKVKAEIVPEMGEYNSRRDLSAFGGYAGVRYSSVNELSFLKQPYIGLNYIHMTGEDNPFAATGDYEEFDPLYEDEIYGEINEVNSSLGLNTNAKIINLGFGGNVTRAAMLGVDYYHITREQAQFGNDDFGSEIDLTFNYQYTEDVTFEVTLGYFDPDGNVGTEEAIQFTASTKISF